MNDLKRLEFDVLKMENEPLMGAPSSLLVRPKKDHLGKWFIGYGTSYLNGARVHQGTAGIHKSLATALARADIFSAMKDAASLVPEGHHKRTRHHVWVLMIYQLGLDGARGFRGALAAYRGRRYNECAEELIDSVWYRRQTPRRVACLAHRMMTGEWHDVDLWRRGEIPLPAPIEEGET